MSLMNFQKRLPQPSPMREAHPFPSHVLAKGILQCSRDIGRAKGYT